MVFNSRYGDYVDIATVEFFRALGFGSDLTNGGLDYQVVKQTVEWKAARSRCSWLSASALGNTSFSLPTEMRVAGAEQVIVAAETVLVLMDAKYDGEDFASTRLWGGPEKGAPGAVTDHAGYLGR